VAQLGLGYRLDFPELPLTWWINAWLATDELDATTGTSTDPGPLVNSWQGLGTGVSLALWRSGGHRLDFSIGVGVMRQLATRAGLDEAVSDALEFHSIQGIAWRWQPVGGGFHISVGAEGNFDWVTPLKLGIGGAF
jgi:hypothetical protein